MCDQTSEVRLGTVLELWKIKAMIEDKSLRGHVACYPFRKQATFDHTLILYVLDQGSIIEVKYSL